MSCRTVHEMLEQARDERLPALVQSALDSHLASCPECARVAVLEDQLAEGLSALRETDQRLELPPGFRREVKERLLASDRRTAAPAPSVWVRGLTGGLAAAACLALVLIATTSLRDSARGPLVAESSPAAGAAPGQQPVSAPAAGFDPALAPLLYATPEVEVLYGGPRRQDLQPAAAEPDEAARTVDEDEAPRRREYHF